MHRIRRQDRLFRLPATDWKALPVALILAAVVAGCGKKESATAATAGTNNVPESTQAAAPSTGQPAPNANPAPSAAKPPEIGVTVGPSTDSGLSSVQQLNRALLRFRMQNHRMPSSVEELASASGIQLPPPPPGKKYAFTGRGFVALVDNTAK